MPLLGTGRLLISQKYSRQDIKIGPGHFPKKMLVGLFALLALIQFKKNPTFGFSLSDPKHFYFNFDIIVEDMDSIVDPPLKVKTVSIHLIDIHRIEKAKTIKKRQKIVIFCHTIILVRIMVI